MVRHSESIQAHAVGPSPTSFILLLLLLLSWIIFRLFKLVSQLLANITSRVRYSGTLSSPFVVQPGVLQGVNFRAFAFQFFYK
jgi:hypothetical protein